MPIRLKTWMILWALLLIGVAACGSNTDLSNVDAGVTLPDNSIGSVMRDAGTRDATGRDAATTPAPDDAGVPIGGEVDLDGVWAVRIKSSQISDIPFVGEEIQNSTTIARVTLDQTGTNATGPYVVCSNAPDAPPTIGTQLPAGLLETLNTMPFVITLSEARVGGRFNTAPNSLLIGWQTSESPATAALPEMTTDPRIQDDDGDGNPGVTIQVTGSLINATVFAVARMTITLNGTIITEDRVEGTNSIQSDQSILQATSALIPLGPMYGMPNPDPALNQFVLVRVPAGSDCVSILRDASTLF